MHYTCLHWRHFYSTRCVSTSRKNYILTSTVLCLAGSFPPFPGVFSGVDLRLGVGVPEWCLCLLAARGVLEGDSLSRLLFSESVWGGVVFGVIVAAGLSSDTFHLLSIDDDSSIDLTFVWHFLQIRMDLSSRGCKCSPYDASRRYTLLLSGLSRSGSYIFFVWEKRSPFRIHSLQRRQKSFTLDWAITKNINGNVFQ